VGFSSYYKNPCLGFLCDGLLGEGGEGGRERETEINKGGGAEERKP